MSTAEIIIWSYQWKKWTMCFFLNISYKELIVTALPIDYKLITSPKKVKLEFK